MFCRLSSGNFSESTNITAYCSFDTLLFATGDVQCSFIKKILGKIPDATSDVFVEADYALNSVARFAMH